jgi:hypothetical protein
MDPDFLREIGVLHASFKPLEYRVGPRQAPARHVDIATARISLRSSVSRDNELEAPVRIGRNDGVAVMLA